MARSGSWRIVFFFQQPEWIQSTSIRFRKFAVPSSIWLKILRVSSSLRVWTFPDSVCGYSRVFTKSRHASFPTSNDEDESSLECAKKIKQMPKSPYPRAFYWWEMYRINNGFAAFERCWFDCLVFFPGIIDACPCLSRMWLRPSVPVLSCKDLQPAVKGTVFVENWISES